MYRGFKSTMIINIVSGSPFDYHILHKYPADFMIGVDFGSYQLIKNNLPIDIALGDFDSINSKELEIIKSSGVKIYKYKSEKDSTDTEIALNYALNLKPKVINLFGVTGKRIDHFLGVLNLYSIVLNYPVDLFIIDEFNKIYLRKPGEYVIKKTDFKYISFFAYNEKVINLTLKNFKYELRDYLLERKDTLCISNEIIKDEGIVKLDSGLLLIVESKD